MCYALSAASCVVVLVLVTIFKLLHEINNIEAKHYLLQFVRRVYESIEIEKRPPISQCLNPTIS